MFAGFMGQSRKALMKGLQKFIAEDNQEAVKIGDLFHVSNYKRKW